MARRVVDIKVTTEQGLIRAVHAVIRDDEDDFEAQLEEFKTKDELLAADAACTDLSAFILLQEAGGALLPESAQQLAEKTAEFASWSGISADEYLAYLNAISSKTPIETIVGLGPALRAPFVLLAFLVINFQKKEEEWHDYLSRAWDALEDGTKLS